MAGEFSLDTNAAIAVLAKDALLIDRLADTELTISATAVGELYYGAFNSMRAIENVAKVDQLIASLQVVQIDVETSNMFGLTKANLKSAGRMIPDNDIWIAAAALQHGLTLVTRDQHFQNIIDLQTVQW